MCQFLNALSADQGNRLSVLDRLSSTIFGILIIVFLVNNTQANSFALGVGVFLVLFALNGVRFNFISISRDGEITVKNVVEDAVKQVGKNRPLQLDTQEPMPEELRSNSDDITTVVNVDGLGEYKFTKPSQETLVSIGNTLTASGISTYDSNKSIISLGVSAESNSVLTIYSDCSTRLIKYGSKNGDESRNTKDT